MSEDSLPVRFKEIEGFPGYRVGDDGSVWSCLKRGHRIIGTVWRRLRPAAPKRRWAYYHINLGTKTFSVHVLILTVFVGPRPEGMEACHRDGDRSNNSLNNLRWDTPKNNCADTARHGRSNKGERHGLARLTEEKVKAIRAEYATGIASYESLGRKHGVTGSAILAVVRRRNWKHVP